MKDIGRITGLRIRLIPVQMSNFTDYPKKLKLNAQGIWFILEILSVN